MRIDHEFPAVVRVWHDCPSCKTGTSWRTHCEVNFIICRWSCFRREHRKHEAEQHNASQGGTKIEQFANEVISSAFRVNYKYKRYMPVTWVQFQPSSDFSFSPVRAVHTSEFRLAAFVLSAATRWFVTRTFTHARRAHHSTDGSGKSSRKMAGKPRGKHNIWLPLCWITLISQVQLCKWIF